MKAFLAFFDGPINWLLKEQDPAFVSLECAEGWKLINPLCVLDHPCYQAYWSHAISERESFHTSRTVGFISPAYSIDDDFDMVSRIMHLLRGITCQTRLPVYQVATQIIPVPENKIPLLPQNILMTGMVWTVHILKTALTLDAARVVKESDFEIAHFYLLDAIQSLLRQDFRQAILNAAIAIEVFARIKLDEAYERALQAVPSLPTLRISELSTKNGKIDPIYLALRNRSRLRELLHELPLYLLELVSKLS